MPSGRSSVPEPEGLGHFSFQETSSPPSTPSSGKSAEALREGSPSFSFPKEQRQPGNSFFLFEADSSRALSGPGFRSFPWLSVTRASQGPPTMRPPIPEAKVSVAPFGELWAKLALWRASSSTLQSSRRKNQERSWQQRPITPSCRRSRTPLPRAGGSRRPKRYRVGPEDPLWHDPFLISSFLQSPCTDKKSQETKDLTIGRKKQEMTSFTCAYRSRDVLSDFSSSRRKKINQDESDPVRPSPPKGASHFEPIPL